VIYAFEGFELDSDLRELRHEGARVGVQPKVLGLIQLLVQSPERVVSRDELFRELWPDTVVSDDALFHALKKARAVLGDDGSAQRMIETVPRVGYRFVAHVEVREAARAAPRAPRPGEASPAAGLVGRSAELAVLRTALGDALAGSGRVALVTGEASIGKSHLVRAVSSTARERGVEVHEAFSWPGSGAPPLWAWVQILRGFADTWSDARLRRAMGESAGEIARLLPAVRERFELSVPAVGDTDEARFLQMDAVARFLVRASAERPQMLVLEDLHWAPPATLQTLGFLVGELAEAPLLVVATTRESEGEGEALDAAVAACAQRGVLVRVPLGGLPAPEIGALVEQVAGFRPSPEVANALRTETGGNPFFAKEILHLALEEAGPGSTEERLAARLTSQREALPEGVRRVLKQRLDALSEPCRRVLSVGAVVGDLPLSILASVLPLPREDLLRALEEARAAQLIEKGHGVGPRDHFAHSLVREAAYDALSEIERARLHRRVAEALEREHAGHLEPVVPALAHHYGSAAPLLEGWQAVDYAKWAGDLASEALSFAEAAEHYERALSALALQVEPASERRRAEILVCAGFAHHQAGARERAVERHREAAALASRAGDAPLLAFAALGSAGLGVSVLDPESVRLLEEALAAYGKRRDATAVQLRVVLATHLVNHPGRSEEARALARAAEALARELDQPRPIGRALVARAHVLRVTGGSPEARLPLLREAAATLPESGDRTAELLICEQLRGVHLELGALEPAKRANARLVELLPRLRSELWSYIAPSIAFGSAMLEGRFADAEATVQNQLGGSGGQRFHEAVLFGMLAAVRYGQGRLGELLPLLDALREDLVSAPVLDAVHALALLEAGERAAARRALAKLADRGFDGLLATDNGLLAGALAAELCARLGEAERARSLRTLLESRAEHWVGLGNGIYTHGPVALYRGLLATAAGDFESAERDLERATKRVDALGSPVWRAHVLAAWARLYRARGAKGDAGRAARCAADARALAVPLGMERLRREADALAS